MIPLAVPNIGDLEHEYVSRALRSGFVSSSGPYVAEFEEKFAQSVGSRFAVACSSGTAAIHIGLIVLGVQSGDEVFCSDFTFIGSANPIAYLGARPTFMDSDESTWNMDPELLDDELTRREAVGQPMPKVLELVHVLGQPANVSRIKEICDRHNIDILEDAAESLGARWTHGRFSGTHTGTVGRVGCFSFNGNKITTTGGGGMIVTNEERLADRARHLTTQAKVSDDEYRHDEVGYNYRLSNVAAALGLAQLERLPEFLDTKRSIASRYELGLAGLPLSFPPRVAGYDSSYWLFSILTRDEDERVALNAFLSRSGITSRPLWPPLHTQPPFASADVVRGEVGNDLYLRGLSLPCSTDLTEAQQDEVVRCIRTFYASRDAN